MSATATFFTALNELVDVGGAVPCWDRTHGNPWIGESAEEREYAAHRCVPCPLIAACGAMALEQHVSFGIFGGLDFTQRPGKRRTDPKNRSTT